MINAVYGFVAGVIVTVVVSVFLYMQNPETYDLSSKIHGDKTPLPDNVQAQTLPDADYNHEGDFSAEGHLLSYGGPFIGLYQPDPNLYTDTNAFGLTRHSSLLNITPETIDTVCFSNEQTIENQFDTLTIKIFLKTEFRQQLIEAMQQNIDQRLTFEFTGYEVSRIVPQIGTIETAKRIFATEPQPGSGLIDKTAEIIFSTRDSNKNTIMRLARYLSPHKVPGGCDSDFSPEQIIWWEDAVFFYWTRTGSLKTES